MKRTVTIELAATPLELAEAFCELNDEGQAQFFIECARIAGEWTVGLGDTWQWYKIGGHLRSCECSTDKARAMVRGIAEAVDGGEGT